MKDIVAFVFLIFLKMATWRFKKCSPHRDNIIHLLKKHLCPIFTILCESVVEKHYKEVSKYVNI